jgi:hypothetical protein
MNDDIWRFGTGLGERVIARDWAGVRWGMRHPENLLIGGNSGIMAEELQSPARSWSDHVWPVSALVTEENLRTECDRGRQLGRTGGRAEASTEFLATR